MVKKDGLTYLTSLHNLRYMVEVEDSESLKECVLGLKDLVSKYDFLSKEGFNKREKEWRAKIDENWKEYKGPSKQYREASRHLRPLVEELVSHLSSVLQKYMGQEMKAEWAKYSKQLWDDREGRDVDHPAREEIYRIIADLIRFFFDWHELTPYGSGIEPPEWGEDLFRLDIPEAKRSKYVKAGKRMRDRFGERFKNMLS